MKPSEQAASPPQRIGRDRAPRRLTCALLVMLGLGLSSPVGAANPSTPADQDQPAKVQQLLELLSDPAVQSWIQQQAKMKAAFPADPAAGRTPAEYLSNRLTAIRRHLAALADTLPRLPDELARTNANLRAELAGRGALGVFALFAGFLALGFGTEWVFLRATNGLRHWVLALPLETVGQRLSAAAARLALGIAVVTVFGLGSIGAFLAFDWPPLLREIVLGYLVAFLGLRLMLELSRFLLAPGAQAGSAPERHRILPMDKRAARFWHRRVGLLVGWFVFGWVTVGLLSRLGFELDARRLVAYILGLGLLAIGLEMVSRRPSPAASAPKVGRRAIAGLLSVYFSLLWLLWVASAMPLFWLLAVAGLVPWVTAGTQRAVDHLLRSPGDEGSVSATRSLYGVGLQRGLRAVLVIGGAVLLAHLWNLDLVALTAGDSYGTRLLRGMLSTVVIVLVAELAWQLLKAMIDRKMAERPNTSDQNSEAWRRHMRLQTLLPIFRNILLVLLLVTVALTALAQLGVDIGPLIAGASVVGVAVGFGSQTLIRDMISGMFYLLDDAFRVGEYIQSGSYKGTVESFGFRSVKLRHHRGPLYTVPFGVLGAVQNMSRDWVIDKLSVGVTYDTDLGKVRKIVKQIGQDLMEDAELAPNIMEPLKMQGVEQFGDFAIQIRMKIMTRPGEQFVIRRRALAMIKQAFDANGINFAFPTVQVAGGTDAAIAASAHQALAKPPAAEEG
jgi:small-conductance mechanosensitive channel